MTKSEKQKYILKLMIIALNEVIKTGGINLDGKSTDSPSEDKSRFARMTIGNRPAVINWFDAGYDELRVSVWWDYQPEHMPTWRKRCLGSFRASMPEVNRRFFIHILGACGSCYLERKTGKFIVGDEGNQFFNTYVREDSPYYIDMIEPEEPFGYETTGRIHV